MRKTKHDTVHTETSADITHIIAEYVFSFICLFRRQYFFFLLFSYTLQCDSFRLF